MTMEEILQKLKAGEIEVAEATRLLEAAETRRGSLYCKVSEKGGVSVYGLQRMPVTLYVEQWEKLLAFGGELEKFLTENAARLKRKG